MVVTHFSTHHWLDEPATLREVRRVLLSFNQVTFHLAKRHELKLVMLLPLPA